MSNGIEYSIGEQGPSEARAMAELIARAFAADKTWGERRSIFEIYIPALLSCGAYADRALSLVARSREGRVLGCALWYPYKTRFGGVSAAAWCLAPLAVDPDASGRGIGSALMRASLPELESRGAALAFLLGHEGYYPRFGFRPSMLGRVGLRPKPREAREVSGVEEDFQLRAPRPSDEETLRKLWSLCFAGVDFALEPEPGFFPWMAWSPLTRSVVLESGGGARAYARYRKEAGESKAAADILLFLADGPESARALLAALGLPHGQDPGRGPGEGSGPPFVPLHPDSAAARLLFPEGFDALSETYKAGMALPLANGPAAAIRAAAAYCDGVASGSRPLGIPLFPAAFDPDDMGA